MEEGRESWRKKIQGKELLLPARFPRPDLRSPPTIKILLRERTSFSCNPHPPPSSIVAPFPRFFVPFRFVSFLCALSFSPRRQSDTLCRGQNTTFCRICKKRESQTVVAFVAAFSIRWFSSRANSTPAVEVKGALPRFPRSLQIIQIFFNVPG